MFLEKKNILPEQLILACGVVELPFFNVGDEKCSQPCQCCIVLINN